MPESIPKRYLAVLLIGASCISFAPIFAKLAVDADSLFSSGISPTAVAFWRLALAMPVFLLLDLPSKSQVKAELPLKAYWLLLMPGLFFAADLAAWHWSFEFTSVANATLEANMASIFVAIFGWLVLNESFNWRFPVGMGLSLVGLIILVLAGSSFDDSHLLGDLLGILTAFCYTGYILSVKVLTRYFGVPRIMSMTTGVGALAILISLYISKGHLGLGVLIPYEQKTWLWLLGLAVLPQLAGQALIAKAMGRLPVAISAIGLLWQPVMTALLGWIILNQAMTPIQGGAGLLILTGILLARKGSVI